MSVIIRGINKLPLYCGECFLMDGETCECSVPGIERTCNPFDGRFDNCPMSFLPAHGRLGDLDTLIEQCHGHNTQRTMWSEIEYLIDNAPTIIPAEEGKT